MTDPTDDDIRQRLRKAAYKGARTLEIASGPLPESADPRDPEWAPYFEAAEMNRMQRAAESSISAWVKSLPQATAPGVDTRTPEEKRAALREAMKTQEVREALAEAGLELRERPKMVVEAR